jgi:hypothetical protein
MECWLGADFFFYTPDATVFEGIPEPDKGYASFVLTDHRAGGPAAYSKSPFLEVLQANSGKRETYYKTSLSPPGREALLLPSPLYAISTTSRSKTKDRPSYLCNLRLFLKLVSEKGIFIYFFIARKTLVAPGKIKG